ncbi:MAG: MBL fold metallo-hydrolase [Candidatus Helarchaeota archaeon]|nr:MBL fold metallo-hydrolase [Candidatus Helarchaeota archaeon]
MSLDFGNGVDSVKITVLSNNTTDLTLRTDARFKGKVIQPTISVVNAIAEHALAMSIEVNGTNILYDFGGMGLAILKNLEILNVKPENFQKAVLSHGHFDHFGTIFKLLPLMGPNKEIIVEPNIFKQKVVALGEAGEIIDINTLRENYRALKKAKKVRELPGLRKNLLEKLTLDNQQTLIETSEPIELAPGVWTSGEIELLDKSELTSNLFLKIDKTTFEEESFRDEIAIYIKVKNKGLIVLTGCGHTGMINTIKYGQKLSGVDKIYAVIGGFHLNWATEEQLDKVVNYFNELKPEIICGMHCTGFKFNVKLFSKMPDNATLGLVGTKFIL